MRVPTAVLQRNARRPQKEDQVPFQELLPLKLRNHVSGKSNRMNDVSCLQEMAQMFACMKTNEFAENLCNKEISSFQKCYKVHIDKAYEAKKIENQGVVQPGKDLNYKQLNKYLRNYPSPF